jgi:hypothetical protein
LFASVAVSAKYADNQLLEFASMVDWIKNELEINTLKYRKWNDGFEVNGLPKENFATNVGMVSVILNFNAH